MCLILVAKVHLDVPLAIAANRDEFHARPAARAAFWEDRPDILAGRDLQAGGTWMGKELAKAGAFFDRCFPTRRTSPLTMEEMAKRIREVGVASSVLTY